MHVYMEDIVRYSLLLDIYGELLTEKQKDIMTLYYNDDLSLAEISEHTSTSRQAVHDIIRRCNKLLEDYDEKLGLLKKQLATQGFKEKIVALLKALELCNEQGKKQNIVVEIKGCIDEFI